MIAIRRLVCSVALLGAFLCVALVSAAGAETKGQGIRYTTIGTLTGTRAYIAGSGHTNSSGFVTAGVIIQNGAGTDGLQIGESKDTTVITDCGQQTSAYVFAEYQYPAGNYVCPVQTNISSFGTGGLFSVALSGSGWEAFWNSSVFYGPINLGMSTGYGVANGEAAWLQAFPTFDVTWGPSGQTAWQYKTGTGGYLTIGTSSGSSTPSGYWRLGGTPSPFDIQFVG